MFRHRFWDATVLTPPASTAAAVAGALGTVELAHLACHGSLRADNPTFSSLQLADGPLTVHELDLRGIAPRRVVLASCEAAADTAYFGATPLMAELHRQLIKGARMAVALHAARQTIDHSDPTGLATWSAFTAYGAA